MKKSNLLEPRSYFKPLEYDWAFEGYEMQNKMHWLPSEVPLHEDVRDWNSKLSAQEKNLLTQLFRFFTQADVDVAAGYYEKFIPLFPKPELRMMMGSFAAMEAVHIHAYSLLLDTVGMPEVEYSAFFKYKEMAEKHSYLETVKMDTSQDVAKSLAVYSAFTEGMQLFSSFAMLLNFPRQGKMKGMGQIVTWSLRDESLHVEYMIKLFRQFIKENKEIWTDEFKKELYEIARKMVDLEDKFIDLAFEMGPLEGLTKEEVKQYIRYIADRRLLQLGLKTNFKVKTNPLPWIEWMISAPEHANFFETRATEYGKGGVTGWEKVWEAVVK